tara:strand:+ start:7860 stop:8465 length:606 start_codon:yes stop_codon:yes gene_type:complete
MEITELKLENIQPYENNPRKKNDLQKVVKSIKDFGFQQPLVLDKKNVIIVGHSRYEAAKQLNLNTVPCVVANISDEQAKAYRIVDNKTNQDSVWDMDLLNNEFNSLMDLNYDIADLGFDIKEAEKLTIFEPTFEKPNNIIGNTEIESDNFNTSNVKMVQLFLNTDTEPEFKKMINELRKVYNTDNLTDTVLEVVKTQYKNL